MSRVKTASLFRRGGLWYVSWWRGGTRVKESTGTDNRKVAEDVRRQREREMILGETDLRHEVDLALNDPRRRDSVLKALETVDTVEAPKALTPGLRSRPRRGPGGGRGISGDVGPVGFGPCAPGRRNRPRRTLDSPASSGHVRGSGGLVASREEAPDVPEVFVSVEMVNQVGRTGL
jgi:hypothetical protein